MNRKDARWLSNFITEMSHRCHEENKVQPVFFAQMPAPTGKSLAARMGRHIWAADRMWQGLISHSQESWQRGAEILRTEPFFAATPDMGVPEARIDEIAQIASRAASTRSWKSRAEIYGDFLAACSNCHQSYVH